MSSKKQEEKQSKLKKLEKELEVLKEKLLESQKKEKEYLEGWQRERADFLNFKKSQEEFFLTRKDEFLKEILLKFLEVVDNFELALKSFKGENQEETKKGFELIYQQIKAIFSDFGVEEIKIEEGDEFKPEIAEAIATENSDKFQPNRILEVVRKGYLLRGKLLRPARVKVSK